MAPPTRHLAIDTSTGSTCSIAVAGSVTLAVVVGYALGLVGPTPSAAPTTPFPAVETGSPAAMSMEPIVAALRDGRAVALGEWHGRSDEHRFFSDVLRDPQVRSVLDSVVVEFGAAPEQNVVDQFVAGGGVPDAELRKIWTTTTQQNGVWDAPVYRTFFETIRVLNSQSVRKLRVVLGDPGAGTTLCDQAGLATDAPCIDRDAFMADRAAIELRSGHRVLVVAGVFHVWRPNDRSPTATARLEAMGFRSYVLLPFGGPLLTAEAVRRDLPSGPPQIVTADWLASIPAGLMRGTATVDCDQPPCETPGDLGSLRDVADGFVYVGP